MYRQQCIGQSALRQQTKPVACIGTASIAITAAQLASMQRAVDWQKHCRATRSTVSAQVIQYKQLVGNEQDASVQKDIDHAIDTVVQQLRLQVNPLPCHIWLYAYMCCIATWQWQPLSLTPAGLCSVGDCNICEQAWLSINHALLLSFCRQSWLRIESAYTGETCPSKSKELH